jgi:heat shock protein HslJ
MKTVLLLATSLFFMVQCAPKVNMVDLTSRSWTWEVAQLPGDANLTPKKADAFVLSFTKDSTMSLSTDCNRVAGTYTIEGNRITFGPMMATRMYCEGAQEQIFCDLLAKTQSYKLDDKQRLVLTLADGNGTIVFK